MNTDFEKITNSPEPDTLTDKLSSLICPCNNITTNIIILFITLSLLSCAKKERSEIEIIKYDQSLIEEIKSKFDSTYIENPQRQDFWTIEHYLTGTTDKFILKDSLDNVVGIVVRENGVTSFAQEYYPNGQAKGKTEFPPEKIDGRATYYYEDGRIRSTGVFSEYKRVGQWKEYNEDGFLISIKFYDNQGNLLKVEKENK